MTTDRELFQQALDVLLVCLEYPDSQDTINALRKRLAQPEQEPVPAEHCLWARNGNQPCSGGAQQKPVALSDEQKQRIHDETGAGHALISLVEMCIKENP